MRLSELKIGETAYVIKIYGRGGVKKRLAEIGFIKGRKVIAVKEAPLSDPVEYKIMGYYVSIRKSEAKLIEVTTEKEVEQEHNITIKNDISVEEKFQIHDIIREKGKKINIALVGNPNCGKTTLFNFASNSREHTGNYGGVTVESKTATFIHKGFTCDITDLPGTYSLTAYSPEELFVRNYIINNTPDVIINVVDATNLERNLYLTTQLIDMDIKIVMALNMYDEFEAHGDKLDYRMLGNLFGIPIIPTVSSKGIGIRELFDKIINIYTDKDKTYRHIHLNYGEEVEQSIKLIQEPIKENKDLITLFSSRYLAIKLLEKDKDAQRTIENCSNSEIIIKTANNQIKRIEKLYNEDTETLITDIRYGIISGALKETLVRGKKPRHQLTKKLDNILTNKAFGFPLFFLFLWIMFQATFKLGEYPQQWIRQWVEFVGNITAKFIPAGPLHDLLIDGIINGVGGVIVFLPNILLLFLFISFMEDTGYMARVAFIMDKLMHKIGLHGKSFIPLILGFGCNVPAIMSTRTIENRNNRLLTILINPFMSCSARLPVYILFISIFFPQHSGTALFIVYLTGILIAVLVALIFKNTMFKAEELPFVMELPPYRMPTWRSVLKHMWNKSKQYLQKMGGVILIASIIIWALGYFPINKGLDRDYDIKIKQLQDQRISLMNAEFFNSKAKDSIDNLITYYVIEKSKIQQENSYISKVGKFIEPVMQPLGFDWRLSVSLLSGITAKEVIVSTLSVLFEPAYNGNEINLQKELVESKFETGNKKGQPLITLPTALSFMIFVLIYFPCIAAMSAISRETNSWKWTLFVIIYTTVLAWVLAYGVFNIANLLV